jgi:hypothetical protein
VGWIDRQTMGALSTTQIAQPGGTRPPAMLASSLLTASGWTSGVGWTGGAVVDGGVVVDDVDTLPPSLGTTTGGDAPFPPRRKPTRKVTPTRTSTAATIGPRDGGTPSGAVAGRLLEVGGPPKLAMSSPS